MSYRIFYDFNYVHTIFQVFGVSVMKSRVINLDPSRLQLTDLLIKNRCAKFHLHSQAV